jgi:hypothetical protein
MLIAILVTASILFLRRKPRVQPMLPAFKIHFFSKSAVSEILFKNPWKKLTITSNLKTFN